MTDMFSRLDFASPSSVGGSSGFTSPLSRPRSGPLRRLSPKRSASYRTAPVEVDAPRVRGEFLRVLLCFLPRMVCILYIGEYDC